MGLNVGYLTSNRTESGDEVYTPFYTVEPLLEFIPGDKIIWCPFDEDWSAFYQLFKEKGYKVIRSSITDGQDFFTYEPQEHWDIMISNPPFSKKDQVLERAFNFNKPFALLLPVNSIQGKKRFNIFKNRIQILAFDARVDYHTNGNMGEYTSGNHFGSAYFCRDILPTKLEMRKLKKYNRPLISNWKNYLLPLKKLLNELCPDYIPNFNIIDDKCCAAYDYCLKQYVVTTNFSYCASVVFPSKEVAQKACDILNKQGSRDGKCDNILNT